MPRSYTTGKTRIAYNLFHVSQLRTGRNYFPGHGFGDPEDPQVMRAMRAAWPLLREQVMQAHGDWWGATSFRRPWGFWRFDQKIETHMDAAEQRKFLLEHPELLTSEEKATLG